MPRCKKCQVCLEVADFKAANKGNAKKAKRFDTANKCLNPPPTTKRRRINEVQQLGSIAFQGGQPRRGVMEDKQLDGEILGATEPSLNPADRSTRPQGPLKEDSIFDADAFDEYCKLVKKCEDAAASATSSAVEKESDSMIPKMRGLMHQRVKYEVDFSEAVKDLSNVYLWWLDNQPAGSRAFIPDLADREVCFDALKIYSCAVEEAEQIPNEFFEWTATR